MISSVISNVLIIFIVSSTLSVNYQIFLPYWHYKLLWENCNPFVNIRVFTCYTHISKKGKYCLLTNDRKLLFWLFLCVFSLHTNNTPPSANTRTKKNHFSQRRWCGSDYQLRTSSSSTDTFRHVYTNQCVLLLGVCVCVFARECYYLPCAPLITGTASWARPRIVYTYIATAPMTDGCARHMINKK